MKIALVLIASIISGAAQALPPSDEESRCQTLQSAANSIIETGARGSTTRQREIIDNSEMMEAMFPELSRKGAMTVAHEIERLTDEESWRSIGFSEAAEKIKDDCEKMQDSELDGYFSKQK